MACPVGRSQFLFVNLRKKYFMKLRKLFSLSPLILIAAGCAHDEQRQARFDESISPLYSTASGASSTPGSGVSSGSQSGSYASSPSASYSTTGKASTQSTSVEDGVLARQVQQSLAQDPTVVALLPSVQITANASSGTVVLSGNVSSEEQKQSIEAIAKQASGVTTVNNQLQVSSASASIPGSDSLSATAPATAASETSRSVGAESGMNEALSPTSRTNASTSIYSGEQSSASSNQVESTSEQLDPTSRRNTDSRIFAQTNAPDSSSLQNREQPISATTTPPSDLAESQSGRIAAQTNASQPLSSEREQPISATSSRPDQSGGLSDNRIYAQTNAPGATITEGEQPISATSSRPDQASRIYESTNSAAGISLSQSGQYSTGQNGGVNVTVQGGSSTDRSLAQQISQELRADAGLASSISQISISVTDGKVSLRGNVRNDQQKRQIESAIQRVTGVSSVENQLRVGSSPASP
jgi:osmotically-inducible protein OsmY